MAKQTCSLCKGKKGRHEEWGTHGKGWYKCSDCGGKGFIIVDDSPRPQRETRPNREQKQRTERPQHTSKWLEKHCAVATCNTLIRYLPSWNNVPSYCPEHLREMQQKQRPNYDEATSKEYPSVNSKLPGSSSTAADMGGDKVVVLGFADGHKHVTVYHGQKGAEDNWRYSWNVDSSGKYQRGSAHFSDSGSSLVRGKFSDERRWFNG